MNNADMPAMPTSPNEKDPEWASAVSGGLTKREHFAILAMQGVLGSVLCGEDGDLIVKNAVNLADTLLKELDK